MTQVLILLFTFVLLGLVSRYLGRYTYVVMCLVIAAYIVHTYASTP
jgi:hypothetical protein